MFKKLFSLSLILIVLISALGIYGYIDLSNRLDEVQSAKEAAELELQALNNVRINGAKENTDGGNADSDAGSAEEKGHTKDESITEPELLTIDFTNANSRGTYFSVHKVSEAHEVSKGKGAKVGILDHSFALNNYKDLYAGGRDFSGNESALYEDEAHGYWMAKVLREIAPECEIYALCTWSEDEVAKADNMINAINWAIENDIDILTYSDAKFTAANSWKIDEAIDLAVSKGLVTTFIHCNNENNLWPTGMHTFENGAARMPDLNILHYDYNTLIVERYKKYVSIMESGNDIRSGDDAPYFSESSTSPVAAGFVAILKSINSTLSPGEYRDILQKTSCRTDFYDWNFKQTFTCEKVADISKAIEYLKSNY